MIYIVREKFNITENKIVIEKDDYNYICNVRRVKKDEKVLFFEPGILRTTIFKETSGKKGFFEITNTEIIPPKEKFLHITLPFADISAIETAIKNGVETGVDGFFLVKTEFSNTKKNAVENRLDRFKSIIESAASQSRRTNIPFIKIDTFENIISLQSTHIFLDPYNGNFPEKPEISKEITIWIGPEGGFSEKEYILLNKSAYPVKFNVPVMRMETAVSAASAFFCDRLLRN